VLRTNWEQVTTQREKDLLKLEESIFHSGTVLARSRKLTERLEAAGLADDAHGAVRPGRALLSQIRR
jgi:hypothetical protein